MIRVLITGKNSYIGNKTENWLTSKKLYQITKISLRDDSWKQFSFEQYDVILHVAGIAHANSKNRSFDLYDSINHQLTKEVALKAKESGVKHFIFLSSMIIYQSKQSPINQKTLPKPKGAYAISKLNAEHALNQLMDESFKVTILRPSMVYGPESKGNFPRLVNYVDKFSIFPKFYNLRSFLYIDHLTEAIHQVIQTETYGVLHLADSEARSTADLVFQIGSSLNNKVKLTKLFNPVIYILRPIMTVMNKLFGDFYYDNSLIQHSFHYHRLSFEDSIENSVKEFRE